MRISNAYLDGPSCRNMTLHERCLKQRELRHPYDEDLIGILSFQFSFSRISIAKRKSAFDTLASTIPKLASDSWEVEISDLIIKKAFLANPYAFRCFVLHRDVNGREATTKKIMKEMKKDRPELCTLLESFNERLPLLQVFCYLVRSM